MIHTTLNKIHARKPCAEGWKQLLRHLGKTEADDKPLALATVLDSNGLDDALWCLRAVDGHQREMRLYAVWCARQVRHLMTDPRSIEALDVAERYANGEATDEELFAAWDAARVAARTVGGADGPGAEGNAAWAAVRAAGDGGDAAKAAAATAARTAAGEAARNAQEAEFRRVFCQEDV